MCTRRGDTDDEISQHEYHESDQKIILCKALLHEFHYTTHKTLKVTSHSLKNDL